MSDYAAGRASGVHERGSGARDGGLPPPVLLGALGAAMLIAVLLFVLFSIGGGDDNGATPPGAAAAAPIASTDGRVRLTVAFEGDGGGRIVIAPRTDICRQACAYSFVHGTRVSVIAVPGPNSVFEGWSKACGGRKGCTFVMDRARALTVTFAPKPENPEAVCDGNADEPAFCADETGGSPARGSDCIDGKDNDGDGLTDAAQDPGCDADDTEADSSPPDPDETTTTSRPPPPAAVNDCADGTDNDRDGLTDSAQDPDCTNGTSETGVSVSPPPAATPKATKPSKSECRDGEDNDGDGLIDRAQDPGCEADGSEVGEEP